MKRKVIPAAPDLSNDVIAVLLGGWGSAPPAGWPRTAGFGGGMISLAASGEPGPAGLWQRHEAYLRNIAKTWNWTPNVTGPDGRVRFYGEHVAAGFRDHEGQIDDEAPDDEDDDEDKQND